MSTLADVDPKDLRPLLHEQIDRLTAEEMESVRRALLKLEAKRRLDALRAEVEEDWQNGKITEAKIEETIRDHRAQQGAPRCGIQAAADFADGVHRAISAVK